jgi:hypothetical protein
MRPAAPLPDNAPMLAGVTGSEPPLACVAAWALGVNVDGLPGSEFQLSGSNDHTFVPVHQ